MGSNNKSSKTPSTAKDRSQKRQRCILQISVSRPDHEEGSVFDDMTDMQRALAFSHYYDHPDQLPDRESGAARRAKQKPLKIRVKFDEAIFERKLCLRPIPYEELEEVDPLSLDSPASSISDESELFGSPSPLDHFYSPLLT